MTLKAKLSTAALLAFAACSDDNPQQAATSATAKPVGESPVTQARSIFDTRCAVCHGKTGGGNGMAAATLNPKPRNYTDPTWQASVQDADIAGAIVKGGAALGKSAMMPPNPDLASQPETVAALVQIIRGFGRH